MPCPVSLLRHIRHKVSDTLAAQGHEHDGFEEEGDVCQCKHGHFMVKLPMANNEHQLAQVMTPPTHHCVMPTSLHHIKPL